MFMSGGSRREREAKRLLPTLNEALHTIHLNVEAFLISLEENHKAFTWFCFYIFRFSLRRKIFVRGARGGETPLS